MKLSDRLQRESKHWDKSFHTEVSELLREAAALVKRVEEAPTAVMDTREALGVCAETEEGFPALYALQGKRVRILLDNQPDEPGEG